MNTQEQLEGLSRQVKELRKRGNIFKWPDEIKKQSLVLCEKLGVEAVASKTQLHSIMLYKWKKKYKKIFTPPPISVTRILTPKEIFSPLLSFEKQEIKIHIYDPQLAQKICEVLCQ